MAWEKVYSPKRKRRLGATIATNDQKCIWGENLVEMGQRNYNTLGNPMEGKVRPRHLRPGQNPLRRNQGRFNHLEPSLVQQSLDSETQILGNHEWKNNQIMGGCLETGTKDGKPRQRDTLT